MPSPQSGGMATTTGNEQQFALTDGDLSRNEQLRRQYEGCGALGSFSSSIRARNSFFDEALTRNRIVDLPQGSDESFERCTGQHASPLQRAIADVLEAVDGTLVSQIDDLLINWCDSSDISRGIHSSGLNIW